MSTITITNPVDMHLHVRQDALMHTIIPPSIQQFTGALIMPNTNPPIFTLEQVLQYRKQITDQIPPNQNFTPYMTVYFRAYTHAELAALKPHITAIKLYPHGMTTGAEHGVFLHGFTKKYGETLAAMQALDIPLCVHGESGGFGVSGHPSPDQSPSTRETWNGFVLDKEANFLPIYDEICPRYPKLRVIMEHITTKASCAYLERYPNLYATITLHHLFITLNDVIDDRLDAHMYCKPVAKRPEDRAALIHLATSAHPKVMLGSDSAPHTESAKCFRGCAGIYTAPVLLPLLAELFEQHGCLANLQAFVGDNAQRIYGLQFTTDPPKKIRLEKKQWIIPEYVEHVGERIYIFRGGHTCEWTLI